MKKNAHPRQFLCTIITLPDIQLAALKALKAAIKKVIPVLTNGGAMTINWENESLDGIIETWHPGQNGGSALADVLFGKYNPAGRLPVTFYRSLKDLPAFEDYDLAGRTYRYFKGTSLYPFGHGLSYAKFYYSNIQLSKNKCSAIDLVTVKALVNNVSKAAGDEVVQVYASAKDFPGFRPFESLVGFTRVHVDACISKEVAIRVAANSLWQYDASINDYKVYKGTCQLKVGGSSEDARHSAELNIR